MKNISLTLFLLLLISCNIGDRELKDKPKFGFHESAIDSIRMPAIPLKDYFPDLSINGHVTLSLDLWDSNEKSLSEMNEFEIFDEQRRNLVYRRREGYPSGGSRVVTDSGKVELLPSCRRLVKTILDSVVIYPTAKAKKIMEYGDTIGIGVYVRLKNGNAFIE